MLATVSVFTVSGATGLAWYCIVTDKTYSESVFEGFKWGELDYTAIYKTSCDFQKTHCE